MLASIREARGDIASAAQLLTSGSDGYPAEFVLAAHAAALCRRLGYLEDAVRYGERASQLRPDDAVALNDLGIAYAARGDHAKAKSAFERAIAINQEFAEPYNGLGLIAFEFGNFPEARALFERFLALKPEAALGYVNLLDSYTVVEDADPNVAAIDARLSQSPRADDEMLLRYARAKAYGDLGRPEAFLEEAKRAAALKRKSIHYDEIAITHFFEDIRRTFSPDFLRRTQGGGYESATPIFVVGMPRSGSTLIEQIIASCPGAVGAGELPDLTRIVEEVGDYPGCLEAMDAALLRSIGEQYVARLSVYAPGARRVVDKMLSNFFYVGLIRLALPQARIVHIRRHPVDTCVSCFTHHFADSLNHTYDLAELGRYYRAYDALMTHWRTVLPEKSMLELRYEEVIHDFERQARMLLQFCGLPWDERVLEFHRTKRAVRTHSGAQVRRPLYTTSIGRWRAYRSQLEPLFEALGPLAEYDR